MNIRKNMVCQLNMREGTVGDDAFEWLRFNSTVY